MNILERLGKGEILLSDGAWGTLLQEKGLQPGECPELWNLSHRNEVLEIAESYFRAGSDIIETNSFGANSFKLSHFGLEERVEELNIAAAKITLEATEGKKYIAGSMGPTGKMLLMGDVTEEALYRSYKDQAIALEKGGCDILIIETMSALDEASIAVKAARENTKCTVAVTMTFSGTPGGDYRTMMGVSASEMVIAMKDAGAHIIGSNCGNGIAGMTGIVREIRSADKTIPILIQANAGMPEYDDGRTVFRDSPAMMASFIPEIIEAGANIIGGCCGTTPAHITAMAKALGR